MTNTSTPSFERAAPERAALQAVLESGIFNKNPRLARLLEHICRKYFEGDRESLKEYSIAADVFGRSTKFDQTTDSIVRVEVHRLRKKLKEFYESEGRDQPVEIVIATGQYIPQFIPRKIASPETGRVFESSKLTAVEASVLHPSAEPIHQPAVDRDFVPTTKPGFISRPEPAIPPHRSRQWFKFGIPLVLLTILALAGTILWRRTKNATAEPAKNSTPVSLPIIAPPPSEGVRIRCGYTKSEFRDREGNIWSGDRYFTGGGTVELPAQYIARTRDSELFYTLRSGTFSYQIPLQPGTYELHLYFAETTYSPASSIGGGENSRVFNVALNGKPLLRDFDIVSDAGANTADVRVFKDVQPNKNGMVRLDFDSELGLPMVNAIEILPGLANRLLPLRMVAQDNFYTDRVGHLWSPDSYFSGGVLARNKTPVTGTDDPGLYAGERYGNFSYALPADRGQYAVTLYLAEKYWGTEAAKRGGIGSRVFDIFCNGSALLRKLDVFKEAGAAYALKKTFHNVEPNAQGKLVISLTPDENYAAVDAIEVEDESR